MSNNIDSVCENCSKALHCPFDDGRGWCDEYAEKVYFFPRMTGKTTMLNKLMEKKKHE